MSTDVIPIFKVLDPYCTPEIIEQLTKLHRYPTVMNDLLHNRLGMIMYRKLKEEVLTLPEKHEEELRIKIPNGDYYTLENVKKLVEEFTIDRRKYHKEHFHEYEIIYEKCLKEFEKTLVSREDWLDYKEYKVNVIRIQKNGYGFDMMPVIIEVNKYEKEVIIPNLPTNMRADFRAVRASIKYIELKILGEVLGRLLNELRTEMTTELIGKEVLDIINNALKKTILFSSYTDSIEIAANYCKKHGLHPVIITGENTKNAAQILSVFKRDPKLNPLIASIKAMSTGHTITEANTVIFLNVPFRSVDYEQASDRVYRISQDTEVYIYKLVLDTGDKPNLSTRMQDIIAWSKESFDAIVGDGTEDTTANGILPTNTIKTVTDQFNRLIDGDTFNTFKSTIDNVLTTIKKFFR